MRDAGEPAVIYRRHNMWWEGRDADTGHACTLWVGHCLRCRGHGGTTTKSAPFTAKDWAGLHSASAIAVASDGAILYRVSYGADKGPTHNDWWTIGADGTHATKLDLAEDFTPMGFSRDGHSLYGAWTVNHHPQFAIFPVNNSKAAAAPSTVIVLPRGIGSASPSPDGKRFAIAADPRPPDPLDDIRHVHEPELTSLYVVNADGTGGAWWCADLKYISGGPILGGGSGATAWSDDGDSLAVLSQLPRIGHHDVSTAIDVCSATGSHHVADIPNSAAEIAWANGGRGDRVPLDQVRGVDTGARLDGARIGRDRRGSFARSDRHRPAACR